MHTCLFTAIKHQSCGIPEVFHLKIIPVFHVMQPLLFVICNPAQQ